MKIEVGRVERKDGGASAIVELVAKKDILPVRLEMLIKRLKGTTDIKVGSVIVPIEVRLDPSLWNEELEFLKEYFARQFVGY